MAMNHRSVALVALITPDARLLAMQQIRQRIGVVHVRGVARIV
jgi:hypothetical protein